MSETHGTPDGPAGRWLKVLLVGAVVGPFVAASVFMLLLAASGGVADAIKALGEPHFYGIFQFVLMVSYLLIVSHLVFFGAAAAFVYKLRHRTDQSQFWSRAKSMVLIYICTLGIMVNGKDIRFSHRLMFLFSLFMAWAVVWFLTRRWHQPVARDLTPAHSVVEARHDP